MVKFRDWFKCFVHRLSHIIFVVPPHEWNNKRRD